MTAGRQSEYEGSTEIKGFSLDMIDYLQFCFEKLEAGLESEITIDPWYEPESGPLTDEKVNEVVEAIDKEFNHEIDNFPSYHYRRSGANAKPEFHRMGPAARRAMVEGLLRIKEEWAAYNAAQNAAPGYPVYPAPTYSSYTPPDYDWTCGD